jgi:hypothetical protein
VSDHILERAGRRFPASRSARSTRFTFADDESIGRRLKLVTVVTRDDRIALEMRARSGYAIATRVEPSASRNQRDHRNALLVSVLRSFCELGFPPYPPFPVPSETSVDDQCVSP